MDTVATVIGRRSEAQRDEALGAAPLGATARSPPSREGREEALGLPKIWLFAELSMARLPRPGLAAVGPFGRQGPDTISVYGNPGTRTVMRNINSAFTRILLHVSPSEACSCELWGWESSCTEQLHRHWSCCPSFASLSQVGSAVSRWKLNLTKGRAVSGSVQSKSASDRQLPLPQPKGKASREHG